MNRPRPNPATRTPNPPVPTHPTSTPTKIHKNEPKPRHPLTPTNQTPNPRQLAPNELASFPHNKPNSAPCYSIKAPQMKAGVIVFPGSNRDHDAFHTLTANLHVPTDLIWHDQTSLSAYDLIVLPGGFSYGDYLRCGAIARFSPVMAALKKFAADGGLVFGICNGFQILVEAGLLPGALIRNRDLRFICKTIALSTSTTNSPFTSKLKQRQILSVPIAHGEGQYLADPQTLDELEAEDRIAFRYLDNPNGSARDIAGILNKQRNVLGMMPHPEDACESLMGSTDGLGIFNSLVAAVATP